MNKFFRTLTLLLALVSTFSLSSCERVETGHVGILVNQYGSDKGLPDAHVVRGMVFFNPWTQDLHEWPTYVQNTHYMWVYEGEDQSLLTTRTAEGFTITTKDGMEVSFNANLNYHTPQDSVPKIFLTYRKDLADLEKGIIYNHLKTAFNELGSEYASIDFSDRRADFIKQGTKRVREILAHDGFVVERDGLSLQKFVLPTNVQNQINAKVESNQKALLRQNELAQSVAEAAKKIAEARGDSAATMIAALAEAKANELRKQTLTPVSLQQQLIARWDGHFPEHQYGSSPQLLRMLGEVAK